MNPILTTEQLDSITKTPPKTPPEEGITYRNIPEKTTSEKAFDSTLIVVREESFPLVSDEDAVEAVDLFTQELKIQRESKQKSTFAGVISAEYLLEFGRVSFRQVESLSSHDIGDLEISGKYCSSTEHLPDVSKSRSGYTSSDGSHETCHFPATDKTRKISTAPLMEDPIASSKTHTESTLVAESAHPVDDKNEKDHKNFMKILFNGIPRRKAASAGSRRPISSPNRDSDEVKLDSASRPVTFFSKMEAIKDDDKVDRPSVVINHEEECPRKREGIINRLFHMHKNGEKTDSWFKMEKDGLIGWHEILHRQERVFRKMFHLRHSEVAPPSPVITSPSSNRSQTNMSNSEHSGSDVEDVDADDFKKIDDEIFFSQPRIMGKVRSKKQPSLSDIGLFKDLKRPESARKATESSSVSITRSNSSIDKLSRLKLPGDPNFSNDNLQYARSSVSSKSPDKRSATSDFTDNSLEVSLAEKYGKVEEIIGKGAHATVRLVHKHTKEAEKLYAVKEFRKKKRTESEKEYVKKVVAEFCIASSLYHENIVETVDLIQDHRHKWCVIMEYMAGGDLLARIQSGLSDPEEIHCYYKQIINGVAYIHSMGVAHRDLKPENVLIDSNFRILKITDFGVAEVFRTAFEKTSRKSKGICGSEPYIAPEEFLQEGGEFFASPVDSWACGVIYYALLKNSVPWIAAKESDMHYIEYIKKRKPEYSTGYIPFDRLYNSGSAGLLYHILEPDPIKRLTVDEIKNDPWLSKFESCSFSGKRCKHVHSSRNK